jgi:hypothetical protein
MHFVRVCFLLLILGMAGCATRGPESVVGAKPQLPDSAYSRREAMVGNWLGEAATHDGGKTKWLVQRDNDGTYQITFRTRAPGKDWNESKEVGYWGISGSTYFTIMKGWLKGQELQPANPTNPYFYDAYKVIRLTTSEFEYLADDGSRYTVKKVPEEYVLSNDP